MDISWGSKESKKFITNVGLITTNGKIGNNIMAAEWTHHVSYSPGLIAVCISKMNQATTLNIRESKQFGVSLSSLNQTVISSIAGSSSGKDTDKIKALKELGFKFYNGKKINVLMVKDAALNVECKLIKEIELGSHTIFIGEAIEISSSDIEPLAYNGGKYGAIEFNIQNPSDQEREKYLRILEKHKKIT